MHDELLNAIAVKKAILDRLRPLSYEALRALQKSFDVDLTYTSNAIEGNTLTLRETAEVIEHGITVGGKSLRDHLEAVDHYQALLWMRSLASEASAIGESTIRELHCRIVVRSQPEIAGIYSTLPRRIAGSTVIFPNPSKIPQLMREFGDWLQTLNPSPQTASPQTAFDAHFQLTAIHPFSDGNGRTARLLMNLILIRGGYPPITVRPEHRNTYLDSLERGSLSGDMRPFHLFLYQRVDDTLAEYSEALHFAG